MVIVKRVTTFSLISVTSLQLINSFTCFLSIRAFLMYTQSPLKVPGKRSRLSKWMNSNLKYPWHLAFLFLTTAHSLRNEDCLRKDRLHLTKQGKNIFAKRFANSVRRALNKAGGEYWQYLKRSGGLRGNESHPEESTMMEGLSLLLWKLHD